MHPVLIQIGSFQLATYGFMTALGYIAAAMYLLPRLKKVNLDKDTFWNLLFTAFMGALIGAKLLFIIVSWKELGPTLADKIATIIHDFRYGFVFFGGMICSVSLLIWYMRKKKLPILKTSDFLIVGLPLGHALGRIGCFCAGCCYGSPTNVPWAVTFTNPHSLVPQSLLGVPLHPTQIYEAIANLILFIVLHIVSNKPHKQGSILLSYLVGYGILRFGIEFFRGDFRGDFILGLSPSQSIAVIVVLFATTLLIFRNKKDQKHG